MLCASNTIYPYIQTPDSIMDTSPNYATDQSADDTDNEELDKLSKNIQTQISQKFTATETKQSIAPTSILNKFKTPYQIKIDTPQNIKNYDFLKTLRQFIYWQKVKNKKINAKFNLKKYLDLKQIIFQILATELSKDTPITKLDNYKILVKYCNSDLIKDSNNITLLHMAIRHGHENVANLLLLNKANPNTQTVNGKISPLHLACQKGSIQIVTSLLNANANVNILTTNFHAPLHISAANKFPDIVKKLLAKQANPNIQIPDSGESPLYLATVAQDDDSVELLLNAGASPSIALKQTGITPLHVAAQNGNQQITKLLLDANASIEAAITASGDMPIHVAAQNGNTEIVKLLAQKNANLGTRRLNDGATPLHLAVKGGYVDTVKTLLDNKVDAKLAANIPGSTPLAIAELCLKNTNLQQSKIDNYAKIINLLKVAIYGATTTTKKYKAFKPNQKGSKPAGKTLKDISSIETGSDDDVYA